MDILSFLQEADLNELFSNLIQAAVLLMGGLVARYLLPWLKQQSLDGIVSKAVQAAEMLYPERSRGVQKKIYVNSVVRAHGPGKASSSKQADLLNMLIEANVQKINQQGVDESEELYREN